jgi:formamidopyrimidine-DNA glycosylase
MPELPEVETTMRALAHALTGKRIKAVKLARGDLRFPFPKGFARRIEGQTVTHFARRAKYILATLASGDVLILHLGMSGRFTIIDVSGKAHSPGEFYDESVAADDGKGAHDHVVFTAEDGMRVVYTDPRRFGLMDLVTGDEASAHKLLAGIGVEPLGNAFDAAYLADALRGKKAPLKAALLDQTIIAGLGNIYVCEALFRARLSPKRMAGTLVKKSGHDPRLDDLVRHIRDVLNEAIRAGGSTLRDYAQPDGKSGAYQQRFDVYDRESKPCRNCGKKIRRIVQSGRSTFYCANCQK